MPLNSDNFLRWDGAGFFPKPFTISGSGATTSNFFANEDFIVIDPYAVCSCAASNSIDYTSFKFIAAQTLSFVEVELSAPCSYDSDTHLLTIYRPLDPTVSILEVLFSFADVLGNTLVGFDSGLGGTENCIFVSISTIYTSYVPYTVSTVCLLDSFGNNTGFKSWGQLQLINMSTGSPIVPLTLKDNNEGDPDYYPPVQDYTTCPPSGAGTGDYAPLVISNFSKNTGDPTNFITVTNVFLSSSNMGPGGSPITMNIPCNIPPSISTRFMVPASSIGFTYDGGITISYIVTGDMVLASIPRYWKKNLSGVVTGYPTGGLTANLVDNSGIISTGGSFDVPDNSQGLIIFAQ